ncbi:Acyl transferase domain-containing protein [Paenibacillus sophorae]|uniref:Phenolphthiocerol/phthiocerol polyketide synthase subunit E n=1 Tax=Paenibacillus sophorae TaxID=1333845 RepID=A0A1H8SYP9_9BACL|nr:type I polyketide synthase [Paenibacillus sophorae]QWU15607.1 acyltransferase domain-containing protein [Paenibacillus sophorae]SEO83635.1 Acyl transferase domain-containing protein [Paenibacillus sophorae]
MSQENHENSIAIVGLSGYFPKARNTQEFWQRLITETECITRLTDEELLADGEDPELLGHPNYVRAKGIIDDPEAFDAGFFGISPAEATMVDPQHRLFLECCWSAIEDAGMNLDTESRAIGVFGAGGMSTYLLHNLTQNPRLLRENDSYQLMLGNDKDYIATRVSFKLNLSGPSISVQTACSSSLVAVHMACQSLLNGECDMALAGGASVSFPHKRGYVYQKGMVLSSDGHCRPFDAKAEGTVEGTGVGVVLLKRLEDAIEDNDRIYSVIRGSAINNDGSEKIGYTAPSVDKQAAVISEALYIAGVDPSEISYVEAHGTGTPLGDPIEITALTKAFRQHTDRVGYCAIGSLKSNLGHLNSAAGIAGLIKVALSLKNECIPASLHYSTPNPNIDFEHSPFFVNTRIAPWKIGQDTRFAGISSFGIGGTNVHMVLSEAPTPVKSTPSQRRAHTLMISAKTKDSVLRYALELQKFLETNKDTDLADVAFTLQTGRREFEYRRAVVGRTVEEAIAQLADGSQRLEAADQASQMVWMFSGQGSQHVGMAREIYASEPTFRREFDACCDMLRPHLEGQDIKRLIFAEPEEEEKAAAELRNTAIAQPALFVVEYSLARLLLSWGMEPAAMLGHSIGEYVAATLAGVMSLQDALALVTHRGRLMQGLPRGSMLSVALAEHDLLPRLNQHLDLDIAAINSKSSCVVSGPTTAVEAFKASLEAEGISSTMLHTSHAFHSAMMEPILASFTELVRGIRLTPPAKPFLSNVTGTWITQEQACSSQYWALHLREAVRFASMIEFLEGEGFTHFVEVGPGQVLTSLARQTLKNASAVPVLPSVREKQGDAARLMGALGTLWSAGLQMDWSSLYNEETRVKVDLPLYSFDRQTYSLNAGASMPVRHAEQAPVAKPKAYQERRNIKNDYVEPENELEMIIAEIWQDLFQVSPIGREDDFFELGGNSLMGIQLLGRIKSIFKVEVSVSNLFESPTIGSLASQVLDKLDTLTEEEAEEVQQTLATLLIGVNE